MTKKQLAKMRDDCAAHLKRWRDKGGKITTWFCAHCKQDNETRQPKKTDVSDSKGCWDSCTLCVHCGQASFVAVWPNGSTQARPMGKVRIVSIPVSKLQFSKTGKQ
jgi:hypothetical protein